MTSVISLLALVTFLSDTVRRRHCLLLALLFGLHPLRVESVAWVAERKDVLSGLLFILSLLAYGQYVLQSKVRDANARLFYVLTMVTFALGLMSKPMLVTVPCVLLLLDWWPLKRFASLSLSVSTKNPLASTFGRLVFEKLPFFFLAVASSIVTFKAQQCNGAAMETLTLTERAENALGSYCRYLGKLFCPVDLAVFIRIQIMGRG
jgi:hypothetical protein